MISISKLSTVPPTDLNKKKIKKKTAEISKKIGHLQKKIYAEKKHSVLVVLQGIDASGKDGATRHVFGECSVAGTQSYSFKKPTSEEVAHDFLWRVHKLTPANGMLMIFNRSHYEDVLIQRVHKWIDEDKVVKRMNAINSFEELIEFDNNTLVLKFFLHISKEKQLEKLKERIEDPSKNWKHNPEDWEEAKLYDEYMKCYEYVINNSTKKWNIIPVDKRWYRDYLIASVVYQELKNLNPKLPTL
ncbi:MAG TPA: PPK2 family polyphosphate kinase [Saprospiraceae bacterium]|nr:PPK2 family polyphosphate kinase [Saprospiraceae bacterium]